MSQTKIYTIDTKDLPILIEGWEKVKPNLNKALRELETANHELLEYINNRTPLSNTKYGHMGEFKRLNLMICPFITKLPAYLKQIKSGITKASIDADTLNQLTNIVSEATEWKESYNKAVAEYKTIQPVYRLTFYNNDGTFDFANWIE